MNLLGLCHNNEVNSDVIIMVEIVMLLGLCHNNGGNCDATGLMS